MQSKDINKLKKLCKDEQSFEKLKNVIEGLAEEKKEKDHHLELLESAIRTDYDSIVITGLNLNKPGPKIVYVNDGFCKMTGYSKEEVIGKTPRILQGPKTDTTVLEKLKRCLSEGQSFFGQAINYRKDGSEFINQWDIHPLINKKGDITHWVSYQHDISERKRAEKQLVDTKIAFDELREESHRTVVDMDVQGNIVMANKSFRELIGYSKDELKQVKVWDLFPNKYLQSLKRRFDLSDEDSFFDRKEFKGIIKHKSGIPIQIRGKTRILNLKNQTLIRAEIDNISLKKRIMNTLKKRNYSFDRVVEKASEYSYNIVLVDNNPILKILSEDFPQITGLSLESVVGKNELKKFIHEDDLTKFQKHLKRVYKGQHSTCEYRLRCKNGHYIEVLDYGKPEWDEENKQVLSVSGAVSLNNSYQKMTSA